MSKRIKLVTSNQSLKSLHIIELRGVKDLDISFQGSPITGIFGMNGSGKSTILQTITCLFRSKDGRENTKMSRFFKYISTNKWIGSEYSAVVDYFQLSGPKRCLVTDRTINYSKKSSEWSPRQAQKPDRNVVFIPLSQSIPDIERASDKVVTFIPQVGAQLDEKITLSATKIMGVQYDELKVNKIGKLDCFTVKRNGVVYHSFDLGAGEQKVFRILQILYRVPDYSLVVIDELDLTLHTAALKELISVMYYEAQQPNRNLQIVFTSHRQDLMKHPHLNIRFLINTPVKTFCLDNPTEDCYEQLTGEPQKYLKIFVEDEVAQVIVEKCLMECGMKTYAQVCRFGSITNSVRLALGIACQFSNLNEMDDYVFFMDGDNIDFTQEDHIKRQIEKTLSGCEQYFQDRRDKAMSILKHLNAPMENGSYLHPEEVIHKAFLSDSSIEGYEALISDSNAILVEIDHHNYIKKLIDRGYSLEDIISAFSKTAVWNSYVNDIMQWIKERKMAHHQGDYI